MNKLHFNCDYFLNKNGKYKYIPNNSYNDILCVLNKYIKVTEYKNVNLLNHSNWNVILQNIMIIYMGQKKDLKYIEQKNNLLCFFDKDIDIVLFLLYRKNLLYNKNMIIKLFSNHLKTLTYIFMINKLINIKILNNELLIKIFYNHYIFMIEEELEKKYNKNIHSFSNYHELYLFLKKKGYVSKYYKIYKPKIIKNFKKIYQNIINRKEYLLFIQKKYKIKSFKDIDIKKYINKIKNKKKIYSYFQELIKKYDTIL